MAELYQVFKWSTLSNNSFHLHATFWARQYTKSFVYLNLM